MTSPFLLAGVLFLATVASAQQGVPTAIPARPAPAPLQVPNPHYVSVPMSIEVNAPVDKVWARIGKYCDIGEWGIAGCTILSGDGSSMGTVRSIGNEVLVGKSRYSYTYTQPVRVGPMYNLYHGTLEAEPISASTTRLNYTLVFDNSMLPDDAAREKDIANRTARFTKMLGNAKTLAEGGTLPAGALAGPPVPPAALPAR
ncbi:MAG: SRPBCC family protein [Janthinobacterium lividum]